MPKEVKGPLASRGILSRAAGAKFTVLGLGLTTSYAQRRELVKRPTPVGPLGQECSAREAWGAGVERWDFTGRETLPFQPAPNGSFQRPAEELIHDDTAGDRGDGDARLGEHRVEQVFPVQWF